MLKKIVADMREKRGWTVRDLAEAAHVPTQTIYNVEEGKSPTLKTLAKIAGAFGVSVSTLVRE